MEIWKPNEIILSYHIIISIIKIIVVSKQLDK
jgi:hypothetical protein